MAKLRLKGKTGLVSSLTETFGISGNEAKSIANNFKKQATGLEDITQKGLNSLTRNFTDAVKNNDLSVLSNMQKQGIFNGTSLEGRNFSIPKPDGQWHPTSNPMTGTKLPGMDIPNSTVNKPKVPHPTKIATFSPPSPKDINLSSGQEQLGQEIGRLREARQAASVQDGDLINRISPEELSRTKSRLSQEENKTKIKENEANVKKHVAESKEVRDEARRHQNDLYHKLINEKSINTDDATIKSIKRHQTKHQPSSSKPTDKEIYNNFQTASNELEQAKTEMAKLQQEGAEDHIIEGARSRLENAQKKYTVSQSKWGNTQTYRNQKAQRLAEERAEREGITIAEASEKNAIDKQAQKEAKKRAKYQENIDWNDVYDNMGFGGVKGKGQKVSSNQQSKTNTSSENLGKEPKNNNTQSGQKSNNKQSGGGLSFSGSAKAHMMKRLKKEMKNVDVNNIDQVSAFLGKQVSEEELKNSKNIKKMMKHKVAQKMKNEGPGVWDYVAGNPNTSAAVGGSLVLTGLAATTMNNGRKSNSQLYSSPI